MIISQEKIEELKGLCEQRTEFKVIGFNGLGEKFETIGRITKDDSVEPAVYENCVFFEFGNVSKGYAPQRTDLFGAFVTDYNTSRCSPHTTLIIDRIELANGEVVFQNSDTAKYLEIAKKDNVKYMAELKAKGRDIVEFDPVTKAISQMVGQPVIIDGKKGVVTSCKMISNGGSVCVDLLDGPGQTCSFIGKDTRLKTTDLQGNIEFIEVNGKTREECKQIDKIFEDRQERILEASNTNIPTGPQ